MKLYNLTLIQRDQLYVEYFESPTLFSDKNTVLVAKESINKLLELVFNLFVFNAQNFNEALYGGINISEFENKIEIRQECFKPNCICVAGCGGEIKAYLLTGWTVKADHIYTVEAYEDQIAALKKQLLETQLELEDSQIKREKYKKECENLVRKMVNIKRTLLGIFKTKIYKNLTHD